MGYDIARIGSGTKPTVDQIAAAKEWMERTYADMDDDLSVTLYMATQEVCERHAARMRAAENEVIRLCGGN